MINSFERVSFPTKHFIVKVIKCENKRNKILKLFINIFIPLFFIIIIFFASINVLSWNKDTDSINKQVDEINNDVVIDEIQDNDKTELYGEDNSIYNDYWYYVKFPLINVDFKDLKNKNSDTVAWINVNNTNINYPIVQTDNNDFYLTHDFGKQYNDAGWVFLDCRNDKYFKDKNTIIYAHSRLDKTMFGSLSKVLHPSWYLNKDNHIIRISNEYENSLWQIFSVYTIETENYYITTQFSTDDEYQIFLDKMVSRSKYNFNTNLNTNDRIITLSTCYDDNRKTVVHAKLLKRELK